MTNLLLTLIDVLMAGYDRPHIRLIHRRHDLNERLMTRREARVLRWGRP